jgi:hypothetical protein
MELNKRKTERSRYIPFIREFLKPANIKNKLIPNISHFKKDINS